MGQHDMEFVIEGDIDTNGQLDITGDVHLDIGVDLGPNLTRSLISQAGPALFDGLFGNFTGRGQDGEGEEGTEVEVE